MTKKPPVASGLDTDRAKTISFYLAEDGRLGMALYPDTSQCSKEAMQGYSVARTMEADCVSINFDGMRAERSER